MQVPMTPIRILKRAVKLYPEKTAVVDGEIRFTYKQVQARVNQVTNAIYNLGIPPGGRIAMLDFNTHRYMEMYFGAAQSGRVLLPLNTQLSADEYAYILDDAEAEAIIFHADFKPLIDQVRARTKTVKYFFIAEGEADISWMSGPYENLLAAQSTQAHITEPDDENDMLNLYYTSGTTGRPKGVMLTHR
ncbi:MAG: AMP-binding protein, partial [Desulfobacterales bacterium]|nr:AMP-binding protein [Desulfobacterales bacterium]